VGDLILSRRNDPTLDVRSLIDTAQSVAPVRNGNRWRVAAIDATTNRVAAERLDDRARVVFGGDYLREYISLGYAVTVHSAQGVTADTSHAVLGENTGRALLYVAMTRGRHANTAHLYQQSTGDNEYGHQQPDGTHVTYRGDSREAATLIRAIIANDDQPALTAHHYAANTPADALPDRVRRLLHRRTTAVNRRRATYEAWCAEAQSRDMDRAGEFAVDRSQARSRDTGIEL
jgi:hypothetical protein